MAPFAIRPPITPEITRIFSFFFQLQKKWVQKVTFVVWLTSNPFLYLYKNGFQWRILFLAPSATSKSEKWWKVLRVFRERSMIFRVMFQAFLGLVHYWYIHQLSKSLNFLLEIIRKFCMDLSMETLQCSWTPITSTVISLVLYLVNLADWNRFR